MDDVVVTLIGWQALKLSNFICVTDTLCQQSHFLIEVIIVWFMHINFWDYVSRKKGKKKKEKCIMHAQFLPCMPPKYWIISHSMLRSNIQRVLQETKKWKSFRIFHKIHLIVFRYDDDICSSQFKFKPFDESSKEN